MKTLFPLTLKSAVTRLSLKVCNKWRKTHMYVVSGSRQRTIMLMEEDWRLGTSPSITHGDLAPDKISSTKLKRVSAADTTTEVQSDWEVKENNMCPLLERSQRSTEQHQAVTKITETVTMQHKYSTPIYHWPQENCCLWLCGDTKSPNFTLKASMDNYNIQKFKELYRAYLCVS